MSYSSTVDLKLPNSPQDLPPELQDFGQQVFNALRQLSIAVGSVSAAVVVNPETLSGLGTVLSPLDVNAPFDHLVVEVFC